MNNEPNTRYLDFHDTPRAMAAMEANYPNGASTGWHTHPRNQLLYAIEGVMTVRSARGSWVVPPSRALWLTANVEHDVRMSGDVKIRTVYIDTTRIDNLPAENRVISVSPLLRELIVAAVQIPVDYHDGGRDGTLMNLLIAELRACEGLPLYLPMPRDIRVRQICESLIDKPSDSSTAEEWGTRLGVAAKTVHRLFLKETGLTFSQWRAHARILFALRRIASGERIIDVSFSCGYTSQSAFTAMFRRHFGAPPSTFYR